MAVRTVSELKFGNLSVPGYNNNNLVCIESMFPCVFLTNSMEHSLLEKILVAQLVNTTSIFRGRQILITVFTRSYLWILCSVS